MEVILAIFVTLWLLLYYIEASAPKKNKISKYAWLARTIKLMLFYWGISTYFIILGNTEGFTPDEPIIDGILLGIGILFFVVGIGVAIYCIIKRKSIQKRLETGKIKPITENG